MIKNVNVAIQVLPIGIDKNTAYQAVDAAINLIKKSGIQYHVCPFETVMEGDYDEIMELIKNIQIYIHKNYSENLLLNLKIQSHKNHSVYINDKIGKYV